ncbi:MAG: acyl-[acyl-carrier-protein]--UDP-N-acetylglucosamine O-acyltransferase, partial [Bacteroidota bacterium]|nr:acyl-[acyl-carrier-protein]--UDP-N-acetylglucosamine O-acyltransferase [Bacteroidota bacterium]
FVKIGSYCMVSGGSLARKDIPPFIKVGREPLSFAGVNSIGLNRKGFSENKVEEIQNIYRLIFNSELNYTQAIEKIEKEFSVSEERNKIINFIRDSSRGIVKGIIK